MKSFGGKSKAVRLERMRASPLMPHVGEPLEPSHEHRATPWWRVVEASGRKSKTESASATTVPKSMPWPIA